MLNREKQNNMVYIDRTEHYRKKTNYLNYEALKASLKDEKQWHPALEYMFDLEQKLISAEKEIKQNKEFFAMLNKLLPKR